jgi:hypothetical protein
MSHLQVLSFISLISAPAANTLSPPVITIALTPSSLSAFSNSAFNSSNNGELRAFFALGRFRVKIATWLEGLREERTNRSAEGVDIARTCVRSRKEVAGLRRVVNDMGYGSVVGVRGRS